MLNVLPSSQVGGRYEPDAPLEFSISDAFSVPFVGSVAVSPRETRPEDDEEADEGGNMRTGWTERSDHCRSGSR
jgi:hypothetical protein